MNRVLAVVSGTVLAAGLLAGCGQERSTASSGADPSPSVTACAREEGAVDDASVLTSADLDGDGRAEELRLTAPDSPCPDVLFATVAGKAPSLRLGLQLSTDSARAVRVPGRDGALVAVREIHPRGGYQVHLYGYADGRLGEVLDSGQPVVPFVATDTKGSYLGVTCGHGALVVRQAVAHRPPGVVFAWDVEETRYRLEGLRATAGPAREVADNVLPAELPTRFPAVARRQLFRSGCA